MKQYCDCCAKQLTPICKEDEVVAMQTTIGSRKYTLCHDCAHAIMFFQACSKNKFFAHVVGRLNTEDLPLYGGNHMGGSV